METFFNDSVKIGQFAQQELTPLLDPCSPSYSSATSSSLDN